MKKIISMILVLSMMCAAVFTLTSCGDKTPKIGVQSGTTGESFVKGDPNMNYTGISGYVAKSYSTGGLAVSDMKNGAVKYVMIDEPVAKELAKSNSGIKVIDVPLTKELYGFGVDKEQPLLLTSINAILLEMQTTGKIADIVAAYESEDETKINPVESAIFDASKTATQLVVATNAAFAPFEYKEGNKFAGIDIEIAKYIADSLKMELVIMDMEFEAVVTSVGKNGVDIAMSGLTITESRKESVNFTIPYYEVAQLLIVPEKDTSFDACKDDGEVLAVLASKLSK